MKLLSLFLFGFHVLMECLGDVVLSEKVMKLALSSAELSSLAYEEDPPAEDFDHFGFYDEGKLHASRVSRNIWNPPHTIFFDRARSGAGCRTQRLLFRRF
jgi:hypothetical protein